MPKKMPIDDPGSAVAAEAGVAETGADGVSASPATAAKSLTLSPILALPLAGIAACAVWAVLGAVLPVFELPEHLRELSGNAPEEQQKELLAASVATAGKNATFAIALLAGVLAIFLTTAEAVFRGQVGRAVWGSLLAALVAVAAATGGGILGSTLSDSASLPEDPLTKTIIVQAVTLGLLGLGVGAGVGLAIMLPGVRPPFFAACSVGGLLGGMVGGLVYPLASSIFLPNARTEISLPDPGASRLLWLGLAAIAVALILTGLVKDKKAVSG